MNDNLTQNLTSDQLKQNISAMKGKVPDNQIQTYVNNYKSNGSGGYTLVGTTSSSVPTQAAPQAPATSQFTYNSSPTGTVSTTKPVTPTTSDTATQPQNEGLLSKIIGGAKAVGDFAFPIVKDVYEDVKGTSKKSFLQQAGDLGSSALWFLPFGGITKAIGGVAKGVGEGIPLLSKLATEAGSKAAGVIGAGAATGYAGDIASNLSEGKTDASVFKPGSGTLTGGAIGGAGVGAAKVFNKIRGQQDIVNKVVKAYEDAAGSTKSGVKFLSESAGAGKNPPEFLAHAGIAPETQEINGRRIFTTGEDSASYQKIQERANKLNEVGSDALDHTGAQVSLKSLQEKVLASVNNSTTKAEGTVSSRQKMVNALFKEFEKTYGAQLTDAATGKPYLTSDMISLGDLNRVKGAQYRLSKVFNVSEPTFSSSVRYQIAKLARQTIEEEAERAGLPGVKAFNAYIGEHLDALDFLKKINGQTVKGGRMGKLIKEGVGATLGGTIGGIMGGGTMGKLVEAGVGSLAGGAAGSLLSKLQQKLATGGSITSATLGRIASENPEALQEFLDFLGKKGGEEIAPMLTPKQGSAGGLIEGLLNKYQPSSLVQKGAKAYTNKF